MLASLIDGFLYAEFVSNEWLDLLIFTGGKVPTNPISGDRSLAWLQCMQGRMSTVVSST